jgi:mannan endo-1,4-beta-mannosidase
LQEFIGNTKENPIWQPNSGLKRKLVAFVTKIVDGNRLNNRITILCAFGWDGKSTNLFTGTMPKQTSWWSSYKLILQNWAIQFKTNPMYGLKYGMNLIDMIELTAIQMPFG